MHTSPLSRANAHTGIKAAETGFMVKWGGSYTPDESVLHGAYCPHSTFVNFRALEPAYYTSDMGA